MNIKSLAIAAAIVTTAGAAGAADLGHPVKAAVDYVKVCNTYGAGFFYIPGSDTCLKLGGFVRMDTVTGNSSSVRAGRYAGSFYQADRLRNSYTTLVRADVTFDARANTEYGLLRSFIDVHFNVGTAGQPAGAATAFSGTATRLDSAYIQLGGLTVGRAQSFFDFYLGTTIQSRFSEVFADAKANLLAYTFAFGNGVSASISLEDSSTYGYLSSAIPVTGDGPTNRRGGATFTYGANHLPDVVANLNVAQAWGAAQIGVAAHEVYGSTPTLGSKWGYAAMAGVNFKLPTLGAGDEFGIQAAIGSGAVGIVNSQAYQLSDIGADAYYSAAGLKLTQAWAIGAGFRHYFIPSVRVDLNGGVYGVDGFGATDYVAYELGAQVRWEPAKNMFVIPFAEYRNLNFSAATNAGATVAAARDASAWAGGVRFQRSF